jgi:tripartite ATP-independent transporter DctM subunit
MEWSGLVLLIMVGAGIVLTGLPAAVILLGTASLGAIFGVLTDTIPVPVLSALPSRLVNLFEYDLLQALPLYVTMGLLLDRLPVAEALYRTGIAIMPRRASAPLMSGMLLGALLGPMNGSVGASVLGLSRVVAPRLDAQGVAPATRDAIVAVASTLGVLVPPSLVLILLSDAMLSAHTLAVTATGRTDRVINTQDIFHAALLPAGILLLLFVALAWWAGRRRPITAPHAPLPSRQAILAAVSLVFLIGLLGGVAAGYFYAVEAAAFGAFALLAGGLLSGSLTGLILRTLLHDIIAITGALFSLLLAATTFTLILRLLGTDRLVGQLVAAIPGGGAGAVAVILGVLALCAFVLDAFEIIFVIVPILIPPLLIRVADARWVAVLVLLTLQASFLLPPFGYALMMVRGAAKAPAPFRAFVRALAPFLLAQWLLLLLVLLLPRLVHFGENSRANSRLPAAPMSDEDINKQFNQFALPPPVDFQVH